MGKNANLIRDMYDFGATSDELIRALKHGIVLLDAEKHHLDWKKSAQDQNIEELYKKYRHTNRNKEVSNANPS